MNAKLIVLVGLLVLGLFATATPVEAHINPAVGGSCGANYVAVACEYADGTHCEVYLSDTCRVRI